MGFQHTLNLKRFYRSHKHGKTALTVGEVIGQRQDGRRVVTEEHNMATEVDVHRLPSQFVQMSLFVPERLQRLPVKLLLAD